MTNTPHISSSALCSQSDVLEIAYGKTDTSALDYSTSDVANAIEDASEEIYSRFGDSKKSMFYVATDQTKYEFRRTNEKTYFIRQIAIWNANDNNRTYLPEASGSYTASLQVNMLTFTASQVAGWNGSYCQVDYIPIEWHLLAKNKAALNLLDADAALMQPGEEAIDNPRVSRIAKRIARIEGNLMPVMAQGSFENRNYDVRDRSEEPIFITQDRFQRNPTV